MQLTGELLIGDSWTGGAGERLVSLNPADGAVLWEGRAASTAQVHEAIDAAWRAFEEWQDVPLPERAELLGRYAVVVNDHKDELAAMIRDEAGKPAWEAATEVAAVSGKVPVTLEMFDARRGESSFDLKGATARTSYRPLGALAVLGPFNFPAHLPNGHIVPALLAGNTVIFKPSELTPATAEMMCRLWQEAGLPAGVLNLVHGGRDAGEALADPERVAGVLFTGGAGTGLALARRFADRPDRMLALELGGNNPLVVDAVADAEAAAYAIVQSAFLTAGQRCTCARRLILTDAAPADLLERLTAMTRRIIVDRPDAQPQPFMGPLITPEAAGRVLDAQRRLIEAGGRAILEARNAPAGPAFIRPGLIDMTDARRNDEEIFGPLLQIIRVDDLDQAIAEANATRFGLAAGLLCDDEASWDRFRRRIRAGVVNWNQQLTGASGQLPFGGVGHSGNFRPSGSFAVDYCNYAVASLENPRVTAIPEKPVGIEQQ